MVCLAHRGFELKDYSHHVVHTLRQAGYWSGLIGEQHLSVDPEVLGYDEVVAIDTNHVDSVAPAALELLGRAPPPPSCWAALRRARSSCRSGSSRRTASSSSRAPCATRSTRCRPRICPT